MLPLPRRASLVLWLLLASAGCVSARNESPRTPEDAGSVAQGAPPAKEDSGRPCVPRSCAQAQARCGVVSDGCGGSLDCGACPGCQPEEMNCCGVCIPRSEGRCPDNIHCPAAAPSM
jgi:hypothetical protein